jgi:hypothetical protein
MRNKVLAVAAALLLPFAVASAQKNVPHNVISIQPLNAVYTAYSAEYERRTGSAWTLGVGGTHWNVGDTGNEVTYQSADVKVRYYPSGNALMGFSLGGMAGYTSVAGKSSSGFDEKASAPTFGILLEYQWLMGASKNFGLAIGAGAKSVMIDKDKITSSSFISAYPTSRVSIGYAF